MELNRLIEPIIEQAKDLTSDFMSLKNVPEEDKVQN
jgi:hypothetical protein